MIRVESAQSLDYFTRFAIFFRNSQLFSELHMKQIQKYMKKEGKSEIDTEGRRERIVESSASPRKADVRKPSERKRER